MSGLIFGVTFLGIILTCLTLAHLLYGYYRLGIAPTPSGYVARRAISKTCCQLLRQRLLTTDADTEETRQLVIYDFGSGMGGLLQSLKKQIRHDPQLQTLIIQYRGIEWLWLPYICSLLLKKLSLSSSHHLLSFHHGDFSTYLAQVKAKDIVLCYLCPQQMENLAQSIRKLSIEDRSIHEDKVHGFTIISLTFALPQFTPRQTYRLSNLYQDPIYIYELTTRH